MIVCLRQIVENGKERSFEVYRDKLKKVGEFKFETYKSSQYGSLGRDLYARYFA